MWEIASTEERRLAMTIIVLWVVSDGVPGVGATRPPLADVTDCRVDLLVVLRDDHEGSPLRIVLDRVSGVGILYDLAYN